MSINPSVFKNRLTALFCCALMAGCSFPSSAQLAQPQPTVIEALDFPTYPTKTTFEQIYIGGKPTVDDELTVHISDAGLSYRSVDISYKVQQKDTLETITTALVNEINTDPDLSQIGVSAASSKTVLTIRSKSTHTTGYSVLLSPQSSVIIHEVWNCTNTQLLRSWAQGNPGATETSRFGINPNRLWYTALSADNSEANAIFNNRLIIFDHSENLQYHDPTFFMSGPEYARQNAEPILQDALQVAQNRYQSNLDGPRDVIDCLCNLGCFYYLGGNLISLQKADTYFNNALDLARRKTIPNAPALAPILEHAAMVARALAEAEDSHSNAHYFRAESMYLESLQIRTSAAGFYKPDVAFSMMNLACLYHDWELRAANYDQDMALADYCKTSARDLEIKVDLLMNPTPHPNLAAELMAHAVALHEAGDNRAARPLARQSLELASHMVLVNSRARPDVVPDSQDLSNPPCPRPDHPCMTVNKGFGQLPHMVAFADTIINKGKKQIRTVKERQKDAATILGNWSVPTDTVQESITTISHEKGIDEHGRETLTERKREEKKSPVEDVTIYLCNYPANPRNLRYRLFEFGAKEGLSPDGLTKSGTTYGWPANHEQAKDLKRVLDQEAGGIIFGEPKKTNSAGDYKFECVPPGDYLLYGSVLTAKEFKVWIIPGAPERKIHVTGVQQFHVDFTPKTGKLLWEAGHPAESQTPDDYFR